MVAEGTWLWRDFWQAATAARDQWQHLVGQRVGLVMVPGGSALAGLWALRGLADVFLFDAQWDTPAIEDYAAQLRLQTVLIPPSQMGDRSDWELRSTGLLSESGAAGGKAVTILTSGSEGQPKAARHTWESLTRPVRPTAPQTWWLSFRVHLYAGLQVVLQALMNSGTLVVPSEGADADALVELMNAAGVSYASGTPSYWRRLVLFADQAQLKRVPLRQITLGGEPIDQAVLDRLRDVFPTARIVHIYATTELGRCFSVTDGQAGFPATYLDRPTTDGVELRIVEGELWVRSANAMVGYDTSMTSPSMTEAEGWWCTGDAVTLESGRVYFQGRRGDMINVGGNKVSPLEVEQQLRDLEEIADVRVFGKTSSIAGQLVACQVVPQPPASAEHARRAVAQAAADWPTYQRPRVIDVVDAIPLTTAGKTSRRPSVAGE